MFARNPFLNVMGVTIAGFRNNFLRLHASSPCHAWRVRQGCRTMKFRSSINFSDLLLNIASSGLAFACAFFAGFMMLKVEGGRGGPEALPVTVDGVQLRAIAAAPAGVDPLTTASVTPIVGRQENAGAGAFPSATYQAPVSYELLSVIDGTAFIEIADISGTRIWPVVKGEFLPGAGQVTRIEKISGHWQVAAGDRTTAEEIQ